MSSLAETDDRLTTWRPLSLKSRVRVTTRCRAYTGSVGTIVEVLEQRIDGLSRYGVTLDGNCDRVTDFSPVRTDSLEAKECEEIMSDSIHDEDDLPTLEEVAQACEYLIEPDVVNAITGEGGYNWTLKQMSWALFDAGNVDTYEAAQTAVREAFKRLRDQDTAIISIAERREMQS